jgi:inositol-phosphate transport system permease protein
MAVHARPAPQATLQSETDWVALARRGRRRRIVAQTLLIAFLLAVSLPILVPYLWMFAISVSAKTGTVSTAVLWRSIGVLVPTVFAVMALRAWTGDPRKRLVGTAAIIAVGAGLLGAAVGAEVHLDNYRFLWNPNIVEDMRGAVGRGGGQFPWVWVALRNSFILASVQTLLVVTVATLAGYYLSRFAFPGRASFLQLLLILHAFPAMTLIIPIFLIMYWTGMLDTLTGVVLILVTLELPFAVFIMKGFFDAVPWDIEMSAMTDGASRRQAFFQVVLPQVKVGILAIGVFAFLKGWEDYVFVRTMLFDKANWVMSLYLFWVADDIMGVDYGMVAAVGVIYVVPSLILYLSCQRFLLQMNVGGIKG